MKSLVIICLTIVLAGCSLPGVSTAPAKPAEPKAEAKTEAKSEAKAEDKAEAKTETKADAASAEAALSTDYSKERTLAELKKNLTSKDPAQRAHAITGLMYHGASDASPDFKTALNDKNLTVQKAAISALAGIKDPEALALFYALYGKTSKHEIRKAILNVLVEFNDASTEEFVLKNMGRMDPSLAEVAFRILEKIQKPLSGSEESGRVDLDSFSFSGVMGKGDTAKVQVEREFFGLGDKVVGYKITKIDPVASLVSLEKDGKVFSKEIDASAKDPAEKAIEKLNSQDDKAVYQALMQLAYLQSKKPSSELTSILDGKNGDDIKLGAIYTIGTCGIEKGDEPLRKILNKEKRSDYLILAAIALAQLGNENSLDVYEPLSQHQNPWVRNAVMSAIGILGSPHGIATLVRGISDSFSFVRNNSADQLMLLAQGGFKGQIQSIMGSGVDGASPAVQELQKRLNAYLDTLPDDDSASDPLTTSVIKQAAPKEPSFAPDFRLVSIGSVGGKNMISIVDKAGEKRNIYEGEEIDGRKLTKIDPDEEVIHLAIENGKTAILEKGEGEEAKANVVEIK